MKEEKNQFNSDRRNLLKTLGLASAAGMAGTFGNVSDLSASTRPASQPDYAKAVAPVRIRSVKAIATAPSGPNLIVVKIETTEPGLYGLGCATFTQRAAAVVTAINGYLNDFCVGKDVDNIEDMWQSFYVSSYWRNGPVLNNALSGMDQALWDIKGKRANMPVYQLLGGKARFSIPCYVHADAKTAEGVADNVQRLMSEGYKHIRIQQGLYGATQLAQQPDFKDAKYGAANDGFMDQQSYIDSVPKLFDFVRKKCGDDVELCHDIHERLEPMDAINMIKKLEDYRPLFLEDPFSPENMGWFKQLRQTTTVPIAMGELFNNINEFREPMVKKWFDYIRCHISQIGGITQAMKIARLGEWFNVRTIWHGPSDTSPVGHAANCHVDLAIWNFGLQEVGGGNFTDKLKEVFPGCPSIGKGYVNINDQPGLGVDINEKEAAKYPIKSGRGGWIVRKRDGTVIRP